MNKTKATFSIICLILFIVSCNGKKNDKNPDFSSKLLENNLIEKQDSITNRLPFTIFDISEKIKNQKDLTDSDFTIICDFLIINKDESQSEEIGYCLFEYLKGNITNNNQFASFLNKKNKAFISSIHTSLIQIMCIDIGEENYNYDNFIKDFHMFNKSVPAKKTFEECMNNQ